MIRGNRTVGWLLTTALALAWCGAARAQENTTEKPLLYRYVALWSVPREQWGEMEKTQAADRAALDKLVADGTLVGYGIFKGVTHTEGHSTHGSWLQASSMVNLLKALDAIMEVRRTPSPVLAISKHWDEILQSRLYNAKPGNYDKAYLWVSSWTMKPGQEETAEHFQKDFLAPLLDKLIADGAVLSFSIDRQTIHTDDPNNFGLSVLTNGAAGLDAFFAALEQAKKKDRFAGTAFDQSVDETRHRDVLAAASFVRR